jgi:hypothetical protein
MQAILAGLAGSSIRTMTGKENRILSVSGHTARVGTGRSPEGKHVDIRDVQDAADRLFRCGEIEISVPSVGYRSAFVGAALSILPDTVAELRPRRIRLMKQP